jgi:hypothetical protein
MKFSLPKLVGRLRSARKPGAAAPYARPAVLALEDRLVPAVTAPTDMTELARLFPRHAGPTVLYVNFDGWASKGIAPFMTISGDRNRDIQDVLYRAAEVFAPFDVEVVRQFGDGNHATGNGDSTIFVGDDSHNGTGTDNRVRAFTPSDYSDHPGTVKGYYHQPNSDSADIAFVDPVSYSPRPTINGHLGSESTLQISRSIAHEAGHTFGLGHVRTDGLKDPAPLAGGTVEDVMSYTDANRFFADRTLNITDFNYNGTTTTHSASVVPMWHVMGLPSNFPTIPYRMQTQNSYTFLRTVLGARTGDDFANVAHGDTVDHFFDTAPAVARGIQDNGAIDRPGDYDVFRLNPAATSQVLTVSALRTPGSAVNPTLLVYDVFVSGGADLVAFNDNRTPTDASSQVTFTAVAGHSYRIVVGSANGNTTGRYLLAVAAPGDPNPDHDGPRVATTVNTYTPKTGILTSILVTFNEDIDPATFTAADVAFVNAAGVVRHPASVTQVSSRQFRISATGLPAGDYTLRIGPDIRDFAGNAMNQNGNAVNGEAADVFTDIISTSLGLDLPGQPGSGQPGV